MDEQLLGELDLARGAVTRRGMLKGLGALAAGAALSACTSSTSSKAGSPTTTLRRASGSPTTTLGGSTPSTVPHVISKPGSLPNPAMP